MREVSHCVKNACQLVNQRFEIRSAVLTRITTAYLHNQGARYLTMPSIKYKISLICPDGNHDPISLPHRELLYVGRSPDTRIVDPRCSRKQGKSTKSNSISELCINTKNIERNFTFL